MSIIKEVILKPRFSTEDLNATASQAENALRPVNKLGEEIEQTFKEAFDPKQVKSFTNEINQTTNKSQSLKARLREIKNELAGLDEGSKRFRELSREAGILEDRIGDVNARVRRLASDTQGLDALLGAAQGIAGAFSIAQGAAALLGKENEDLQKALLRVQASLSVLNGLQAVAATLNKDSAFSVIALGKAKQIYTWATTGATAATNAFRTALIATGVGAAVAGLGLIIAYWDEINEGIVKALKYLGLYEETQNKVTSNSKEYNEQLKETKKLEEDLNNIRKTSKTSEDKIRGLNLEITLLKFLGASQDEIKKKTIELKQAELEQSFNKLKYIELLIKERGETSALIGLKEKEKQNYSSLTNQLKTLNAEKDNSIKKNEQLISSLLRLTGLEKTQIQTVAERAAVIYVEALKRKLEQQRPDFAKQLGELLSTKVDVPPLAIDIDLQRAISRAGFRPQLVQAAVEIGGTISDALFQITQNRQQAEFDREVQNLNKIRDARLANEELTAEERLAIQKQYEQQVANLRKQQFKREQQAAVAQALINGALSVTSLAARTPPPSPAFFTGLGLIATTTAAQIGIIKSTPPPAFKDGVIDFKGKGTATSDSNLVRISTGESVMTAAETQENYDALMAIRKGQFEQFVNQRAFELERMGKAKSQQKERKSNIRKRGKERIIIDNFDQIGASVASRLNYAGYTKRR
jgi:hypothetical protein